uniref:Uncharacterized protein n=1 Tax=Cacopsylla melanoneura TaxID=428564 RepID=A0A8D9ED67_9HEMI
MELQVQEMISQQILVPNSFLTGSLSPIFLVQRTDGSSSPIPSLSSSSSSACNDRRVRERMGSNGVDNRMVKGSRTNQQKEWHINVKELIAVQMSLDSNLDYLQNKVVLI